MIDKQTDSLNISLEQSKGIDKQVDNQISLEESVHTKHPDGKGELDDFMRVGHDYFEKIYKKDRYGVLRPELKVRKKSELKCDFGKSRVKNIKKYDDFILEPNNLNYKERINNCYNLYKQFCHNPEKGKWKWTKILLEHVFGEQYELGIKYLQALYLHPKKSLPILALVSAERQTGKSTFIDYLTILFGGNIAVLDSKDLKSSFNSIIAESNIIAIEETFVEKSSTIETVKALATQKTITVNKKYVQQYSSPFYGKIIMASNNERKFIKIDPKEIRFFVRKLFKPKFKNHNILKNLRNEIPAFLHHLQNLPKLDWSKSRQLFTVEELKNDSLLAVQEESKNWLYHELYLLFVDELNNVQPNQDLLMMTISDIKERWFSKDNSVQRSFIRKVLVDDFEFENPDKTIRYWDSINKKIGRPYFIPREYFGDDVTKTRELVNIL